MARIRSVLTWPVQQAIDGASVRGNRMPAAFGGLATLVSLVGSWVPSLWGDEAASAMSAQRSIPSLFWMLGHVDAVHGAYYLGLHAWVAVFGASAFSLRLPSAVAVGLTVMAVVVLVRRLSTPRVTAAAGILCAMLPRVTYMGEDARSFAFSAAIAAWLTVLLVVAVHRRPGSAALWISYGVLLALGIYLFLFVALLIVVHLAVLLRGRITEEVRRALLWRWATATAAALLAAAPLFAIALRQREQIAYLTTAPQVTFVTIALGLWFGNDWWFAAAAWLLLIVGGVDAVVRMFRGRRRVIAAAPALSVGLVAGAWLIVPSALLIVSHYVLEDFTARYLSFCAPAAAILMAVALDRLVSRYAAARRWASAQAARVFMAGVLVLLALAAPVYLSQRQPHSKNDSDWAQISATLARQAAPGDAVVFDETVRPSLRPRLAMHTYPAGFAGLKDVALDVPFQRNRTWYDKAYGVGRALELGRFDGIDRVWLVEYSDGITVDGNGLAALHTAGYSVMQRIDGHRSVIIELIR
ncbi:MAG: glycosyltransferase family 39 protein [Terrimesophilobacter sp.]